MQTLSRSTHYKFNKKLENIKASEYFTRGHNLKMSRTKFAMMN